jgi:hypothetical protein
MKGLNDSVPARQSTHPLSCIRPNQNATIYAGKSAYTDESEKIST